MHRHEINEVNHFCLSSMFLLSSSIFNLDVFHPVNSESGGWVDYPNIFSKCIFLREVEPLFFCDF